MDFGTCRACRRTVWWSPSAASGALMPLEEAPESGNVIVDDMGFAHVFPDHDAAVAGMDDDRFPLGCTYVSHHATCPEAERFRRPGRSRKRGKPKRVEPEEQLF